jgi:hypothetical protein
MGPCYCPHPKGRCSGASVGRCRDHGIVYPGLRGATSRIGAAHRKGHATQSALSGQLSRAPRQRLSPHRPLRGGHFGLQGVRRPFGRFRAHRPSDRILADEPPRPGAADGRAVPDPASHVHRRRLAQDPVPARQDSAGSRGCCAHCRRPTGGVKPAPSWWRRKIPNATFFLCQTYLYADRRRDRRRIATGVAQGRSRYAVPFPARVRRGP